MSNNRYILSDAHLYPEIDLKSAPVHLGVTALSIAETVRSKIPTNKSKYDRNEKVDELYRTWSQSGEGTGNRYEKVVFLFYEFYRPKIMAIAKKYRALSPIFDDEDLQQTALLGVFQALIKYNHAEHIDMKFSTYLEWSVRNTFQRTIGYTDKFVEVYDRNDAFLCVMSYQEFLVKKKKFKSHGHRHIIRSRQCYLSDVFSFSEGIADNIFSLTAHSSGSSESGGWFDECEDRAQGVIPNG